MGAVIEKISQRKGDLVSMTPVGSRYRLDHALHGSPIIRSMICLLMRTWTRLRL